MEEKKVTPQTIEEYIVEFTPEIQEKLVMLRKVIKEAAPEATEKISWGMPTFVLHGNLIHFAAFKNHIELYPSPSGIDNFKDDLSEFKSSKGAIQFTYVKEMPYELISKIVKFRVIENIQIAENKMKKKN